MSEQFRATLNSPQEVQDFFTRLRDGAVERYLSDIQSLERMEANSMKAVRREGRAIVIGQPIGHDPQSVVYCQFCGQETEVPQFDNHVGYYPKNGESIDRRTLGDVPYELRTNPSNTSKCCDAPVSTNSSYISPETLADLKNEIATLEDYQSEDNLHGDAIDRLSRLRARYEDAVS